jgi:glycosyltransferase involved in cell wall biosynthesis
MASISVVVPAFNAERTLARALDGLEASLAYLRRRHPSVAAEILVVDDASKDRTAAVARDFAQGRPHVRVLAQARNRGAGAARNEGVRRSAGDILFFADADDVVFERHLFVGYDALARRPDLNVVQTKVRIDEELHPDWRAAIEDSVVFNKAVRRAAHDFIGGFFESPVFKVLPCEDVYYAMLLDRFFGLARVDEATVHHFRRPGNALDRQIHKFRQPRDAAPDAETRRQRQLLPVVDRMFKARLKELESRSRA